MHFHANDPSALLEKTFRRIHSERMIGLPMLNPAIDVAAVGFALMDGKEWRGILVTPWGVNLLLLPAIAEWPMPESHARAFRDYAAGSFAFLGNREDDLGDYLTCPLIHDMAQFADQETAVLTACASLLALDIAPPGATAAPETEVSPGRRKFLGLGNDAAA